VYDKVDHRFFSPSLEKPGDYLLAVGREQRDYQTLIEAISGTNINVLIIAFSPWSTSSSAVTGQAPENIQVCGQVTYNTLRELYAGARLVVVPLFDVDYAAGVNSVLEAMAMAKPAIVSSTQGIADYIQEAETGMYVPCGDPEALRETILSLWENAHEQMRLGSNARQAVVESMNLDIYVDRIASIVHRAAANA
jgi:glycosyltransferase involved in cell wall biosynthesis